MHALVVLCRNVIVKFKCKNNIVIIYTKVQIVNESS